MAHASNTDELLHRSPLFIDVGMSCSDPARAFPAQIGWARSVEGKIRKGSVVVAPDPSWLCDRTWCRDLARQRGLGTIDIAEQGLAPADALMFLIMELESEEIAYSARLPFVADQLRLLVQAAGFTYGGLEIRAPELLARQMGVNEHVVRAVLDDARMIHDAGADASNMLAGFMAATEALMQMRRRGRPVPRGQNDRVPASATIMRPALAAD